MGSIPSLSEQETAQTFLDISNGVKFKRNVFFFTSAQVKYLIYSDLF